MEEEEEEVVLLRLGDDIGTVDYEDLVSVGIVWWLWWRSKRIYSKWFEKEDQVEIMKVMKKSPQHY